MKLNIPSVVLILREVKLPLAEIGPSRPTRMMLQNTYDNLRSVGYSPREAIRELEGQFPVYDVRVDTAGKTIVFFKTLDESVNEAWQSMTPGFAWHHHNVGYNFTVLAHTPNGKVRVGGDNIISLPRARAIAKDYRKQTGYKVEVFDAKGRKYFTLG